MRITRVEIHNFRSIVHAAMALGPYSLLVGPNNCGKSNVIEALLTFYDKRAFDEGRDLPLINGLHVDSESWIDIEYELAAEEWETLAEKYKADNRRLRLRKWFVGGPENKKGIFAYEKGSDRPAEEHFYGWNDVNKLGTVIHIPALSKADEHTKLSGPSALRDIIGPIISQVVADSRAGEHLNDALRNFGHTIRTWAGLQGSIPLMRKVEDDITTELADWGFTFEFSIDEPDTAGLLKILVIPTIKDSAVMQAQTFDKFGQGLQRHLIFTLLKLRARIGLATKTDKKTGASKKAKKDAAERVDFSPRLTLLLFEEPEAFLHPQQIDLLHTALETLSQGPSEQVVITTHSPQFASNNIEDVTAFVRLHRQGGQTRVHQIDAQHLKDVLTQNAEEIAGWQKADGGKFRDISTEDLTIDMEAIKYALWLNPIRCKALFAQKVVLVEGPTETALLSVMADRGILSASARAAFAMDAMGKYNMHRFMSLLGGLGIPHGVLCDEDRGKFASTVDATIGRARNKYTLGIEWLPDDVEAFLGIPACKEKHRKPQHLMFHLQRGAVADSRLRALAEKIDECLRAPVGSGVTVANATGAGEGKEATAVSATRASGDDI